MSFDGSMSQLWYIHIMEYDLAIKRNELLIHEISWKNPQIMSLKEKKANPQKVYTV